MPVSPHIQSDAAELLMRRRICARLDLLHPDTSKTVNDRQSRSITHKKFKLGDSMLKISW